MPPPRPALAAALASGATRKTWGPRNSPLLSSPSSPFATSADPAPAPAITQGPLLQHRADNPSYWGYYIDETGQSRDISCSSGVPYVVATALDPPVQYCPDIPGVDIPKTIANPYHYWPYGGCVEGQLCCPEERPDSVKFLLDNGNVAVSCGPHHATYRVFVSPSSGSVTIPGPASTLAASTTATDDAWTFATGGASATTTATGATGNKDVLFSTHSTTVSSTTRIPSAQGTSTVQPAPTPTPTQVSDGHWVGTWPLGAVIALAAFLLIFGIALITAVTICSCMSSCSKRYGRVSIQLSDLASAAAPAPPGAAGASNPALPAPAPRHLGFWSWKTWFKILTILIGLAQIASGAYFGYLAVKRA